MRQNTRAISYFSRGKKTYTDKSRCQSCRAAGLRYGTSKLPPIKHAWCLNEDHMLEGLSSHPSTLRLHLARLSFLAKNIRQMARELCDDSPGVITTSNQPEMIAYTILNDLK